MTITLIKGWEDITVRQWIAGQMAYREAIRLPNDGASNFEKSQMIVSAFYGLTDEDTDTISLAELNTLTESVQFLEKSPFPPLKEPGVIHVNGRRYRMMLPGELPMSSLLSVIKYVPNELEVVEAFNYYAARLIAPVRRNYLGVWTKQSHDLKDLEIYREDMAEANICDVWAVVFWYNEFFMNLTENILFENCPELKGKITAEDLSKLKTFFKNVIDPRNN